MFYNFFFIGLPYAALVILLVGSIFRYSRFGFKVSSLSSQFLEGRELFFGSRTVPVRLVILEATALGFAILAAFGMIMLIIRRFKNKRILAVTSKMDVFVYVMLITQVGSGIWLALSDRWGSVWFASVLTPYLKSIFVLNPDIAAVIALPLVIKIHIISAFIFIGMIPFTRFIHFLVYPFVYIWRPYIYVIWNWDRKTIRNSRKLVNGVRSKNN